MKRPEEFNHSIIPHNDYLIKKPVPIEDLVKELKRKVAELDDRMATIEVDRMLWVNRIEYMFDTLIKATRHDKALQSDVRFMRARFLECYRSKSWREILAGDGA